MSTTEIDMTNRIALARSGIADKLGELQQRGARVRAALSPLTYLANPWLRIGIGIGVGYLLGSRRRSTARPQVLEVGAPSMSLSQMVVRSTVLIVAEAAVRRVVRELASAPRAAE